MTAPLLELFTAGKPVPQPRASPGNRGRMIMAPRDHSIRGWRDTLRMMAQLEMRGKPLLTCAIRMELLFLFPMSKKMQKTRDVDSLNLHYVRPDWDNVGKATDSFTGVIWQDDGQVSTVYLRKRYARPGHGEKPGVLVRIYEDRIPWEVRA